MVFNDIDRIIESVLREQLIIEGTHVSEYRERAVKALIYRGISEEIAREVEKGFFTAHFHGMHNKIIRLEEFFIAACTNASRERVSRLLEILDLIKRNWQKDGFYDISKLNRNNASRYEQLNNLFGPMLDEEKKSDDALANSQEGTRMTEGYSVRNVTSFEEANKIGEYSCPTSKLCFTTNKDTWDKYTNDGTNECYVILRDGWENMNHEDYENDPNRPYDDYGLSMIFLFIKPNGEIRTSNTRWNHKTGGRYQGDVDQSFKKSDIAKLLGVNFDEVFKPGNGFENKFKKKLDIAMQRLANGEAPYQVFDYCLGLKDGLAKVGLCGKRNFINQNSGTLLSNQWFDECWGFKEEGFAGVRLDDKYNFISENGEILYKPDEPEEWFDECYPFNEGFAVVVLDGKGWNFISENGEMLYKPDEPEEWFEECFNFSEGFAVVVLDGKWNFIKQNGELLSPNQWFDLCLNFREGFAVVNLNHRRLYIDKHGNLHNEKPNVTESRILTKVISESIRMTLRQLI